MASMKLECNMHPGLVALSVIISFVGCYLSVSLGDHYRMCVKLHGKLLNPAGTLVVMAVTIGGAAIWCMHFAGMSAMTLSSDQGNVPIKFNVILTAVSFAAALVSVYAGLYICSLDRIFSRDREEIFDMLLHEMTVMNIQNQNSTRQMWAKALLQGVVPIMTGGTVAAAGLCIMHYVGMMAIEANVIIEWNAGMVVASVLFAWFASTAAFWIIFRVLPLRPDLEILRVCSALFLTAAVCCMHYTGMLAAEYYLRSNYSPHAMRGPVISETAMATIALGFMFLFSWMVAFCIMIDLRTWPSV